MKLIIPPKLELGPGEISIEFNEPLMLKMDLAAYTTSKDEKIYLSTGRSARQTFAILFHELLHIAANETGWNLEEASITGIANLLSQAFLSMGIEPDFSQIPVR